MLFFLNFKSNAIYANVALKIAGTIGKKYNILLHREKRTRTFKRLKDETFKD